jgi:hypothetical protein
LLHVLLTPKPSQKAIEGTALFVLHSTTFNIKACKPLAISARCFLIATLHRILFAQWLFGLVAALILMCIAQTAAPSTGSPEFNTPTEATQNSQESAEDAATLESSYRRAWQLVKDNTMYPERLKNWSDWEHKFDGKISTSRRGRYNVNAKRTRRSVHLLSQFFRHKMLAYS